MPRGRSLSKGRRGSSYPTGEGQLVDSSTKQLLLSEFGVKKMGHTVLRGNELFTESTANAILDKHLRKKKSSGSLNFLVDRIRYKRKSGTSRSDCILYREIKHFYRFPSEPDAFMLCVEEESNGKRSYQTYTGRTTDEVNSIQQLIHKTRTDPQCLLRDIYQNGNRQLISDSEGSIRQLNGVTKNVFSSYETPVVMARQSRWDIRETTMQSPLFIERTRSASPYPLFDPLLSPEVHNNFHYAQRVVPVKMNPPPSTFCHTEDTPSPALRGAVPEPQEHRDWIVQLPSGEYREVKLMNPPPRTKFLRPSWNEDVTFISNNNSGREPQVSDKGPVYMYVSRSERPSVTSPSASEPRLRKKKAAR